MTSPALSRPHQLTELHIPASRAAWHGAGFDGDPHIRLGTTWLTFDADAPSLTATIDGVDDLDGLALASSSDLPAPDSSASPNHSNSATSIDHVVVMTPDCDRTTSQFERAGIEARRVRLIDTPSGTRRQTFFWLGDVVCELVGPDEASGEGPSAWWGLALTVSDLDHAHARLGDNATEIKDAVQPGRMVCTVRSSAGLAVPTLLISPHIAGVSSQSDG